MCGVQILTGWMPFLSASQRCQSSEGMQIWLLLTIVRSYELFLLTYLKTMRCSKWLAVVGIYIQYFFLDACYHDWRLL